MVYVISKDGKPLMPTRRHGKVRRLLKSGLAKVVKRTPFTIQLLYKTTEFIQANSRDRYWFATCGDICYISKRRNI